MSEDSGLTQQDLQSIAEAVKEIAVQCDGLLSATLEEIASKIYATHDAT